MSYGEGELPTTRQEWNSDEHVAMFYHKTTRITVTLDTLTVYNDIL